MKKPSKTLLMAMLVASTFLTSNCGKGGRNKDVTIVVTPAEPILINADIEINDDETCSAPWYYATFTIENRSDYGAVIAAIKMKYFGIKDGQAVEGEDDTAAEDFWPYAPYLLVVDASPDSKAGKASEASIGIYFCGAQETDDLTFTVEAKSIGWFGEATTDGSGRTYVPDASERLEKDNFFTVR